MIGEIGLRWMSLFRYHNLCYCKLKMSPVLASLKCHSTLQKPLNKSPLFPNNYTLRLTLYLAVTIHTVLTYSLCKSV